MGFGVGNYIFCSRSVFWNYGLEFGLPVFNYMRRIFKSYSSY